MQEEEERATRPSQVSEDVRFFIYENDRPRALVEAARMERYERDDSTYTLLEGVARADAGADSVAAGVAAQDSTARVTAHIYEAEQAGNPQSNAPAATIRSNRLIYHDDVRRFDAHGQVIVTTNGGKRLESEHLSWLEEERRIFTPDFVRMTTPTDRIQGYGLRADENLDNYQLRRVTGQVTVEETP